MAVKVMVAPAIAKGELGKATAVPIRKKDPAQPAKPKRRRSSVYDADGNEVFITLMCLKCHKMRPLSLFGLRKMADGAIRNQPWCRTCRSGASDKPGKKDGDPTEIVDSPVSAGSPLAAEPAEAAPARANGHLSADIAAALAAGRG